jgi:hypothetical protein
LRGYWIGECSFVRSAKDPQVMGRNEDGQGVVGKVVGSIALNDMEIKIWSREHYVVLRERGDTRPVSDL